MTSAYHAEKKQNLARMRERPFGDETGRADYVPTYIQLEHTSRCNAECIMCNHFFLGNNGARDLDPGVLPLLEPVLERCTQLMLNGDGEPFLYADISDALRLYARDGIRVGTNTNLCAVPEELFPVIDDTVEFLNISCDGATKEVFERIRKGLSFDTFQRKMASLRQYAPHVRRNLDCVLMLQNITELPALVERASSWGCHSLKLHMLGVNPCIGNEQDTLRGYPELTSHFLALAEQRARALGLPLSVPDCGPVPANAERLAEQRRRAERLDPSVTAQRLATAQRQYGSMSLGSDYLSKEACPSLLEQTAFSAGRPCTWPLERCYIDLSGNLTTCCFNTRYRMGNILEAGSFDAVWNGDNYRCLRRLLRNHRLPGFCGSCEFFRTESAIPGARGWAIQTES